MMADFHVHYCGSTVQAHEWDEHLASCDPTDLEPLVYATPVEEAHNSQEPS